MLPPSTSPSAYTSSHFFPKFDNESPSESSRLTSRATTTASSPPRCLAVTKKHSGHLVMAPPFYSKNGVGNRFSRAGALLLSSHFAAVFPDSPPGTKFADWWFHSEAHRLCYSFECVVPSLLGDHGATPLSAYMVLTAVSDTRSGRFLSPAQVLALATLHRLPLNESWYVPWSRAPSVEASLHSHRWTMTDSSANALLSSHPENVHQHFLQHKDTQGEVLEGFVLMALDVEVGAIAPLIAAYEESVRPHRDRALASSRRLGERFSKHDPTLLAQLDAPPETWPDWPAATLPDEPVRINSEADEEGMGKEFKERVWDRACECDGSIGVLFNILRNVYKHRVFLKPYLYNDGVLQIHIDVKDDQIFFGWPLHMALSNAAPLFRGMVVTLSAPSPDPDSPPTPNYSSLPSTHVLGIAKLKCLNYLIRTFGVRNLLPVLLKKGATAYASRTLNFFRNWSVPASHQPRLSSLFSGWAAAVSQMGTQSRADLEEQVYLRHLEPYLRGEWSGFEQDEEGLEMSKKLRNFALIICNLSGEEELPPSFLDKFAPGMTPFMRAVAKGRSPAAGDVSVMTSPTGGKSLTTTPTLVIVLPPPPNTVDRRLLAMAAKCEQLEELYPPMQGRVFTNPGLEEWKDAVSNLAASSPPPLPPTPPREVKVVMVLALPPGGGKTTFFEELRKANLNAAIVSSDAEKARSGNKSAFDVALGEAIRRGADCGVVGYDKNVPNVEGLAKALRVLENIETEATSITIKVVAVIPSRLEHDVAWARVQSRTRGNIALNVHGNGEKKAYTVFKDLFFEPAAAFLGKAQNVPGALVTDAFWGNLGEVRAATEETLRISGVTLEEMQVGLEEAGGTGGTRGGHAVWACVELPATRLHVTLVPPPGSREEEAEEGRRKEALQKIQKELAGSMVEVGLVRYLSGRAGEKRVGMWTVEEDLGGVTADAHYGRQREIYHISDLGALVGTAPKDCARLLRLLRAGAGEGVGEKKVVLDGVEWTVSEQVKATGGGAKMLGKVACL